MSQIRQSIAEAIEVVWCSAGQAKVEIRDSSTLSGDLQLNSLDLAQLVVQLEQSLHVDPFRRGTAPVRTFGELVALYEKESASSSN